MLYGLLVGLQILASILIILAVILHPAKGEGFGGLGGAPAQLFGSQRGAESGLNQITVVLAVIWALCSVVLASPHLLGTQ